MHRGTIVPFVACRVGTLPPLWQCGGKSGESAVFLAYGGTDHARRRGIKISRDDSQSNAFAAVVGDSSTALPAPHKLKQVH